MYHNKNYLNNETKNQIDKKGFSVYNYISMKELLLTVNKDYLEALNFLNIPFAVLFLIVGFIVYNTNHYEYFIYLFSIFYGVTFLYLIGKLVFRTYKFSQVTNIIYTKKGLVIGNEIFHYEKEGRINNSLLKYQEIFDEYLSKPSKLSENIKRLKEKLLSKLGKNYSALEIASKIDERLALGGIILLTAYSVSIFLFYWLGFVLGFLFFILFISFINIYFLINKSIELKIKNKVTLIDVEIKKLDEIYIQLENKIKNFKDGEISNLSKNIEEEFNSFYKKIDLILTQKDYLKNIIENSIYNDFIDFEHFAFYVKEQFNNPLNCMIGLLEKYKISLKEKIEESENILANIVQTESYQIEAKLINLKIIDSNLEKHLKQLKKALQ